MIDKGALSLNHWRYRMNETAHHTLQLYIEPTFLYEAVLEFLLAGLEKGEAAVLIARPETVARVTELASAVGTNLQALVKKGSVVCLDANFTVEAILSVTGDQNLKEECLHDFVLPRIKDLLVSYPGVRIFSEAFDVLTQMGKFEISLTLERLWGKWDQNPKCKSLCSYSISSFSKAADVLPFRKVCALHDVVYPSEKYQKITKDSEKLLLIAENQQLTAALESECTGRNSAQLRGELQQINGFSLDPVQHKVFHGNHEIRLTACEYKIFHLLASRIGQLVSRSQLMTAVTNANLEACERSVDVHVFNIRKKLKFARNVVQTVRGLGYRMKVLNQKDLRG